MSWPEEIRIIGGIGLVAGKRAATGAATSIGPLQRSGSRGDIVRKVRALTLLLQSRLVGLLVRHGRTREGFAVSALPSELVALLGTAFTLGLVTPGAANRRFSSYFGGLRLKNDGDFSVSRAVKKLSPENCLVPPSQRKRRGAMMPRFIALLLIALMFVCSPVMAGAAPDPCGVADSCKTCVATDGCGWCGESLECKKKPGMFGGGCKGMLKETSMCTPLRDSLVRLGDSLPEVSTKMVAAYDAVRDAITV